MYYRLQFLHYLKNARQQTLLLMALQVCFLLKIAIYYLRLSGKVFFFFVIAGPSKFQIEDVKPALAVCTHLIYGYAHINSNFEIVSGSPNLDTGSGYAYYRLATQLKRSFPDVKIYLSVGGNSDPYDDEHKYLVLVSITTIK